MKYLLQITKALAADDVHVIIEPKNDIEALDIVRDLKDSSDDGWRLVKIREGLVDSQADIANYVLRSRTFFDELLEQDVTITAKAELHVSTQNDSSLTQYDTIAEAFGAIEALHDSDGYVLVDEFENNSKVIYEHTSLWKNEDGSFNKTHGRLNNHGRDDVDRI